MLLTLNVVRCWKQLLICALIIIYLHSIGSARYATVTSISLRESCTSSHPRYLDTDWKKASFCALGYAGAFTCPSVQRQCLKIKNKKIIFFLPTKTHQYNFLAYSLKDFKHLTNVFSLSDAFCTLHYQLR